MPEEQITITGEVGKIAVWSKGNGYFLGLVGNENDFYAFGSPKVKVGQKVTFEVAPGTGTFSDKTKLVKLLKELGLKEKVDVQAKKEVKEMQGLIDKGDKVYFDTQELIVKQCCIKAAAVVIAAHVQLNEGQAIANIGENVVDLADRFYCYICRGEGPEEPLPEDE